MEMRGEEGNRRGHFDMGEAEETGAVKGGEEGEQGGGEKSDDLVQVKTGGEVGSKQVEYRPAIK